MEKKKWLWNLKSSKKTSTDETETETSGSSSSHHSESERNSNEQHEILNESTIESNQSPELTTKAVTFEDANMSLMNEQSHNSENINGGLLEKDESGEEGNVLNGGVVTDGLRNVSEKLTSALVNVNANEDLIKQHAKVAEEAIAGWEKAENEVTDLKKQLEALKLKNSAMEDQVTHLDGALKECVRQLRQTREEHEQDIQDAVLKKTEELESTKTKLENQLIELKSKLHASNGTTPLLDFDMCQKVEYLEKENMDLKQNLQAQSKKLEIMTIERDLSIQAAETASKQHLESINKVVKLEAECRRLESIACRTSSLNDHKSILTDSQSESCSDSWASALIAELDQFKKEKCRQIPPSCSVEIDLMDDFLEMEQLAAQAETKNESLTQNSVVANQCIDEEISLRKEFDIMNQQIDEQKEKSEKEKAERVELEISLMKSEKCIEASHLQMREAETKLEELERKLENSYKSKQVMLDSEVMNMESKAQSITTRVNSLEEEVVKERAMLVEIASKCMELEEELESKKQEEKLLSIASSYNEMKINQEDLAIAAGKLAECQKTIASLGDQLNSLATLED